MQAKANVGIILYVAHSLYGLFRYVCFYSYGKTGDYSFSGQLCYMKIYLDDLPAKHLFL